MEKFQLRTPRLVIRSLCPDDLAAFHSYRSSKEVMKYQGSDAMDEAGCAAFIEEMKDLPFGKPGQWVQYALALHDSDELIGDCAIKLHSPDPRIAEVGVTISPKSQQQGFAKEAMQGILKFLFAERQIHRVQEIVDAENEASIRLLQSLGFRQEGHFVENIWFNGKWGSEYQFALLRREWAA